MKILTKDEEDAHYAATVRGGISGGLVGLGIGLVGAVIAHKRWPLFHNTTLPFKSFIVTSSGTFAAVIAADKASRNFEAARHGESSYQDRTAAALAASRQNRSFPNRILDWGRENRYKIVSASWVGSMGAALWFVSRDKYLTRAQKLVQARVYAQGLTLLVLVASAGFEVADARKGQSRFQDEGEEKKPHVEAYQGEDLWKDMVEAEERRKQRVNDRNQREKAGATDA